LGTETRISASRIQPTPKFWSRKFKLKHLRVTVQLNNEPARRRLAFKQTLVDSDSQSVNGVEQAVSDAVGGNDEQRQTEQTVEDAEDSTTGRQRRSIAVAFNTHTQTDRDAPVFHRLPEPNRAWLLVVYFSR